MRRVALLRGINVGGNRKLPMEALRTIAGDLGFTNVATYIQSGNLFFDTDVEPQDAVAALRQAIDATFGFSIDVMVRSLAEVQAAAQNCPLRRPMVPTRRPTSGSWEGSRMRPPSRSGAKTHGRRGVWDHRTRAAPVPAQRHRGLEAGLLRLRKGAGHPRYGAELANRRGNHRTATADLSVQILCR
ncbi:MAG: DUF1697 domain-containing protein [Acidimicrobiales bacterium]